MTDRLYYSDPYKQEFDAVIERVARDGRTVVWLDRTAFYPTSGGQPFDRGTLGGYDVVDVFDDQDDRVAHVLSVTAAEPGASGPPPAAGDPLVPGLAIRGRIDWTRRFDHMQQHTGQHVLSATIERLFAARTVSFHLGITSSTIDLDRELPAADVRRAEIEANQIVWDDRPVSIRFASAEEAAGLPLRKESLRTGTLRLIEIAGCDLSACGGTHVARTGAIGMIAADRWERFKGGQRLEFLCGGRALHRFGRLRDALAAGVRALSVLPEELPAAIERLQVEAKAHRRTIDDLRAALSQLRADSLAAAAEPTPNGRLVACAIDGDATALKATAVAVAARPGHIAALVSTAAPFLIVIAAAADVPVPARAIVAAMVAAHGGRGGGNENLAQAGGLSGPSASILNTARAEIVRWTHP